MMSVALTILSVSYFRWIKLISDIKDWNRNPNAQFCTVFVGVFALLSLANWLPLIIPGLAGDPFASITEVNCNVNRLITFAIVTAVGTTFQTLIVSRLAKNKIIETKVHRYEHYYNIYSHSMLCCRGRLFATWFTSCALLSTQSSLG